MNIFDKIICFQQKSNTPQRVTIALVTPLFLLVFGYGVIDMVIPRRFSPLGDFDETWWMWCIVLLLIGGFEYFWLSDQSKGFTADYSNRYANSEQNEPSMPSPTAIAVCSIIGWGFIVITWLSLYGGGGWGDQRIASALRVNNYGYALGLWFGGSITTLIAFIAGIIIRRHGAGIALVVAALITFIATFTIM